MVRGSRYTGFYRTSVLAAVSLEDYNPPGYNTTVSLKYTDISEVHMLPPSK
jgi:hypothetical protein